MVDWNRLEEYSHCKHAWQVHAPAWDKRLALEQLWLVPTLSWFSRSPSASVYKHCHVFVHITPVDGLFSPSFDASAPCSSFFCVYSLRHHVCCLSDGLVLFGFPASLSSSACWCKCWATLSGSGSCSNRTERGIKGAGCRLATPEDSCDIWGVFLDITTVRKPAHESSM